MISIHQRVFLSAMFTLCLFLGLSVWVLESFFKTYVENNMQEKLQNYVYSLLASANEDDRGRMRLPEILPNPALNQPDSGVKAYVIGEKNSYKWSSASALNSQFDQLSIPDIQAGEKNYSITKNNLSRMIFAVNWEDFQLIQQHYIIVIEISRTEIEQQIKDFRYQLSLWIGGSSFILLLALLMVLNWSLKPLRKAVSELQQVQKGEKKQLSTNYPHELLLLSSNINQLIQLSVSRLQRYRNSLGDLTHSLKTPLAIIQGAYDSQNNQQLRTAISEQLGNINELVQYQLQRASIAGESSVLSTIEINSLVNKIIRSLNKVYIDKQIKCDLVMDSKVSFRGDEGDFMELFGNLLDNAYKYCNSHVKVTIKQKQKLTLLIEDNGPGIDDKLYGQLLQRGERADSLTPGHGIGLGIVKDIIRQYNGKIELSRSETLNGLRVLISI